MASRDAEDSVYQAAKAGLQRFLGRARDAVMTPFRQFRAQPNPNNLYQAVPVWQADVDRIMVALTPALQEGWAAAHLPGEFDPGDPFITSNLALTHNLLVRIPDEVHAKVVRQILEGTNAGETTDQIAQRVDNVLNYTGSENWDGRARLIAQTETTRHRNSSALAHGLLVHRSGRRQLMKRWQTTMDTRERRAHKDANGQVQQLADPFIVGGEQMLFPGDPTGSADNVCNCVPGSATIMATGIQAAFRFLWSGPLVELSRESGFVSSVSPNHPILTERGWLLARELVKGDQLICASSTDAVAGSKPDEDGAPSTAEEVFETLRLTGGSKRVIDLPVNFYGDRPDTQVDVVSTNSKLSVGMNFSVLEQFEKFEFACAHAPISSGSSCSEFLIAAPPSSAGRMSLDELVGALLRTHELPLESFSFGSVSQVDSTVRLKSEVNSPSSDTKLFSQTLYRTSCEIFLDKVIDIKLNPFAEVHLYTFQTNTGIYVADNIVSHNCRCDLILEDVEA